jgi:hypothetical protein
VRLFDYFSVELKVVFVRYGVICMTIMHGAHLMSAIWHLRLMDK